MYAPSTTNHSWIVHHEASIIGYSAGQLYIGGYTGIMQYMGAFSTKGLHLKVKPHSHYAANLLWPAIDNLQLWLQKIENFLFPVMPQSTANSHQLALKLNTSMQ